MANEIVAGMGFHHVALKAHNFEESFKFFTEGLGMKFFTMWGEGDGRIAMLDMGDGSILELFAGGPEEVGDVDAAYNTAIAAGAKPKTAPKVVPLDSHPVKLTLNCAFVYGPSGEELEFFKIL